MTQTAWEIVVLDEQGLPTQYRVPHTPQRIYSDVVWFDRDMDRREVERSLIDHDGYPYNILARRRR